MSRTRARGATPLTDPARRRAGCGRLSRLVPASLLLILACHSRPTPHRAIAGPDVFESLRASGEARVVIALVSPPSQPTSGADASELRTEIAQLQLDVLSRLGPADYRAGQRFESVPALSGTLLSEKGLLTLLAHPNVRRVDLDPGGSGSVGR